MKLKSFLSPSPMKLSIGLLVFLSFFPVIVSAAGRRPPLSAGEKIESNIRESRTERTVSTQPADKKRLLVLYLPGNKENLTKLGELFSRTTDFVVNVGFNPRSFSFTSEEREFWRGLEQRKLIEPVLCLSPNPLWAESKFSEVVPQLTPLWHKDLREIILSNWRDFSEFWGREPAGFLPAAGILEEPFLPIVRKLHLRWVLTAAQLERSPLERYGNIYFFHPGFILQKMNKLPAVAELSRQLRALAETADIIVTVIAEDDFSGSAKGVRFLEYLKDLVQEEFTFSLFTAECLYRKETTFPSGAFPQDTANFFADDYSPWFDHGDKINDWEIIARARLDFENYQNRGNGEMWRIDAALNEFHRLEDEKFYRHFRLYPVRDNPDNRDNYRQEFQAGLFNIYKLMELPVPASVYNWGAEQKTDFPETETAKRLPGQSLYWADTPAELTVGSAAAVEPVYDLENFWIQQSSSTFTFVLRLASAPLNGLPADWRAEIYLDLNHRPYVGNWELLGDKRWFFNPADAWEFALRITPQGAVFYRGRRGRPAEIKKIPLSIDQASRLIMVSLESALLGGNPQKWGYGLLIFSGDELVDYLSPDSASMVFPGDSSRSRQALPVVRSAAEEN